MTTKQEFPFARQRKACPKPIGSKLLAAAMFALLSFAPLAPNTVHAVNLPALENLRPKWEQLSLGVSVDQVIAIMGDPNVRDVSEWLGLRVEVLTWTDYRFTKYTARFLAGRLASKHFSD